MAIILVVCCLVSLTVPALAATTTSENILTYELSCDNGGTDKHNITVSTGDVITVAYTITASARSVTATTQDQIIYDHTFFELVTEGDKPCIYKEATYADAFTTSNPIETDGTHYIYFNSTSNVTFTANKATQIGTFKLKVVATTGSSTITNTNYFATDKTATLFGSAKQDLTVTIGGTSSLEKETTPSATFAATGDSTGTLSGLTDGMKYSTNGGTSWTDVPAASTSVDLTGLSACTIKVVKKGNGTTTTDSDAQTITVTKAETPTTVGKTDCTTASNNDGTLTNVTDKMEYKKSTDSVWTAITSSTVTGRANGTYNVRVKASGTVLASGAQTVTIAEYVPDALTGTASISGTAKYGETLTASLTGSNNTGNLSYQWKRDGVNISGATSSTYTAAAADIDKNITVTISSDVQTGSQTSSSVTIAKADGPAAPSCTFSFDGTDAGKLMGSTTAMEYSLNGGTTWNDCASNTALTVANITVDNDVKVRVKETATNNAGVVQTIDITKAQTPTTVDKTDCTTGANNDGTLTNVTTAMEYKKSDESTWDAIVGTVVTDLDNGTYNVRIKASGTVMASDAQSVTIAAYDPGNLGGTASITGTLKYGETLTANTSSITGNTGTFQYQWKRGGTVITGATNSTYTTSEADIGKTISVDVTSTVQNGTITGTASATIVKADQTTLTVNESSATFGTPLTLTTTGGSGTGSVTYTVTAGTGTATINGDVLTPTKAGTVTVVATKAADNCYNKVDSAAKTVTIAKAAAQTIADKTESQKYTVTTQQTKSFAYQMPSDAGTLSYTKGTEQKTGTVTVTSWSVNATTGAVTYTLADGAKDNTVTLPVIITSDNYADSTVNVVITLTDKDVPVLAANDYTGTYTGSPVSVDSITGKGATFNGSTVSGTWSWKNSAPTNVAHSGSKTLVFTPDDTLNYAVAEKSINVTINKAQLTGAPTYTTISEEGKTLADANLTKNAGWPAGTLSWTDSSSTPVERGKSYGWTFTPSDNANYDTLTGSITPWPNPSSGGGGGGKTTGIVPVSGDDVTVKVEATVNGTEAALKIDTSKLDTVIDENVKTGTVTVDLTELKKNIATVTIPAEALKDVAKAAEDSKNDVTSFEVKMTDGSVKFDATALESIAKQADGADLKLVVDDTDTKGLNNTQKTAVKELNLLAVYDIYMTSNGKRISNFEGGSAEVTVRHKLKAGEPTNDIVVLYVADDGNVTVMPHVVEGQEVVFTVTHFSNYVVTHGNAQDYSLCPRDYTCPIEPFTDTKNDFWWHDGIHYCVENGLMVGFPGSVFKPDAPLSRAQIVMILWRMEGSPVANYAMSFKDVKSSEWYTEAIRWAQSTGVVLGYNDDAFGPDDNVTREQLAAILHRYAGYKKIDVSARSNLTQFTDAGKVSDWALDNVKWAVAAGMVNGRTETTIVPLGLTTRAEAATMIQRFCVNILHK